jgi:heat shock protein HslJ/uncharacterized lipoprotein YbaY
MLRFIVAGTAAVLAVAAGCATVGTAEAPRMITVKGQLAYAQRVALPGNAGAIVEVRDTSQPEGKGVVAERRIELRGRQVPIPFELEVDPARLEPGRPYAVRGGITLGGRPAWISDPVPIAARSGTVDLGTLALQPVRIGAFPSTFVCGDLRMTLDFLGEKARLTVGQAEWEMRQTRAASGARFEAVNDPTTWFWNKGQGGRLSIKGREYPECREASVSGADVQGVEWIVEDINGGGIIDRSRATLVFGPDGRLSGRGSCNAYTGRYAMTGDGVTVSGIAGTKMSCAPSLMAQEARFHEVLRDVKRFEIRADGALVLHTDDRRSILARRGGTA